MGRQKAQKRKESMKKLKEYNEYPNPLQFATGFLAIISPAIIIATAIILLTGCKTQPLDTVQNVDLVKYQGTWYEITKIPNKFEKNLIKVQANYTLKENGRIEVKNTGFNTKTNKFEEALGEAKVNGPGKLGVSFFKPFYGDYYIMELDEDYQWVLVGSPSRDYLWILAREPEIPANIYEYLTGVAKAEGFDISRLEKMQH